MRILVVINGGGPGGPFQGYHANGAGPDMAMQIGRIRIETDWKIRSEAENTAPVQPEVGRFEPRHGPEPEAQRYSCSHSDAARRPRDGLPRDLQMKGREIGYRGISAAAMATISDHYAGPTD
ncbi:MAG: hypothetical protein AAF667_00815 [Pseudomonadota bacterium]